MSEPGTGQKCYPCDRLLQNAGCLGLKVREIDLDALLGPDTGGDIEVDEVEEDEPEDAEA